LSEENRGPKRIIALFLILRPGLEVVTKMSFERELRMADGGHVIGYIVLNLDQHPHNPSDCGSKITIVIHHEARGHRFGKEALIAILDYILLGHPTTLRNGNLGGLGLHKAFIETAVANDTFRGLMEGLHLKRLEREATPDHGQNERMQGPCVNYTVTRPVWLEARKHITMDWMLKG